MLSCGAYPFLQSCLDVVGPASVRHAIRDPADALGYSPPRSMRRPGGLMRLIDYFDRGADLYPDRHCLHDGTRIGALPRSPVGKVLKKTLREPHWAGRAHKI
jgi:hypothetical protein